MAFSTHQAYYTVYLYFFQNSILSFQNNANPDQTNSADPDEKSIDPIQLVLSEATLFQTYDASYVIEISMPPPPPSTLK